MSVAIVSSAKTVAICTVPDVDRAAPETLAEPSVVWPLNSTEPDRVPDGVSVNGLLHKLSVKSALLVSSKREYGPEKGLSKKSFEPVQEIVQLAEMEHKIVEASMQEFPELRHSPIKVGVVNGASGVSVPMIEEQTPAEVTPIRVIRVKTKNNSGNSDIIF